MFRTEDQWIEEFKKMGAYRVYTGNPKDPHPLLASGSHSASFVNGRLIDKEEKILKETTSDLIELYGNRGGSIYAVDFVVGVPTGGTKLAEFLARELRSQTSGECFPVIPARHKQGDVDLIIFTERDSITLQDRGVLICDDVITTGGSIRRTIHALAKAGAHIIPYVLTPFNRSPEDRVNHQAIVTLIDSPMPTWVPSECPLCREGSRAIDPQTEWDRFAVVA